MGAAFIIRVFGRLILLVVALAIVRRSVATVGTPSLPGSRGSYLPWLGLMFGVVVLFELFRSCLPFRL